LSTEENVGFWIDDAAKIMTLADGTPLIVRRFDDRWISAARSDVSYELDRQDGILTYASSTTKDDCDDHNWVGPVQTRCRSGGLRVTQIAP
jgi:hypothetical protein